MWASMVFCFASFRSLSRWLARAALLTPSLRIDRGAKELPSAHWRRSCRSKSGTRRQVWCAKDVPGDCHSFPWRLRAAWEPWPREDNQVARKVSSANAWLVQDDIASDSAAVHYNHVCRRLSLILYLVGAHVMVLMMSCSSSQTNRPILDCSEVTLASMVLSDIWSERCKLRLFSVCIRAARSNADRCRFSALKRPSTHRHAQQGSDLRCAAPAGG